MAENNELEMLINNFIEPLKSRKKELDRIIKEIEYMRKLMKEPVKNSILVGQWIIKMETDYSQCEYAESLSAVLSNLKESNKKNQEELHYVFGKELRELFEKEGLSISGNFPELIIKFFQLKIDFQSGNASLHFARELVKSKIKLTAKNIYNAFKEADKEITGRAFHANEFIKLIYEAYRQTLLLSGMESGKRINIISVLKELAVLMQGNAFAKDPRKENYKGYSRACFSYDLYRLKQQNILEYDSKRLNLGTATIDYADKDTHSLFVVDELGGTYIMSLSFIEEPARHPDTPSPRHPDTS